jgi:hypothetical protein
MGDPEAPNNVGYIHSGSWTSSLSPNRSQALEDVVREDGTRFLSVKTLGPSRPDENYQRTRLFYDACGFAPLEEFLDL